MDEVGGGFGEIPKGWDPKPLGSILSWLIGLSNDKPFKILTNPTPNQVDPQEDSRP